MGRYISKEFLSNCAHETGSIVCTVETPRVKDYSSWNNEPYISATVAVADCHKKVNLDFDATGQRAYEKRLAKLDKMIEELTMMRTQYVAMWENGLRDFEFFQKTKGKEDE